MQYPRIYTGPDKISHFEQVELELDQGSVSAQSSPVAAQNIMFGHQPGGLELDWHPAPRRQFVIVLDGEIEIEASDGEVRRFGPGMIFLADDTTGKGHILRGVGSSERHIALVPLAD
jgi:quercetin dioxygenase-like cupin family protein